MTIRSTSRAARRGRRASAPAEPLVGIARHGRLHETTVSASIGKFVAHALVVMLVAGVAVGGLAYARLMGGMGIIPDQPGQTVNPIAEQPGGINILLVGSDDRTGQGSEFGEGESDATGRLNDVNMVIHIAQDLTHAEVISIPRDTIIDAPACTNDQGRKMDAQEGVPVNSILEEGGMRCVTSTIEAVSGLDIHYSAMVKFKGVIAMSNAVGGVPVCVSQTIDDTYVGLYLEPGEHMLQGEDALKFLRSRHGVGDGSDLARISNQQVFLSSLIRTIKSSDTLTNPAKLYGLASAVTQNMALSKSLSDLNTLMSLASAVASIPTENIAFISLPVADSSDWAGKVEPMEPDADNLWAFLRQDLSFAQVAPTTEPTTASAPTAPAEQPEESETATPTPTTDPAATDPAATPAVPADVSHLNADQVTCANTGGTQ